ncbi:hypothetical protein AVEN_262140-1 [Araneus ventricosus]|uniref:Uncharacterized protein n=1 Tax=Araneus ventricosus TaxID=182803 RepID=A0A4Y2PQA6_ARAVE|nr:hypothetical protein AVEN_262140-1 [Araneus ventricosus]
MEVTEGGMLRLVYGSNGQLKACELAPYEEASVIISTGHVVPHPQSRQSAVILDDCGLFVVSNLSQEVLCDPTPVLSCRFLNLCGNKAVTSPLFAC